MQNEKLDFSLAIEKLLNTDSVKNTLASLRLKYQGLQKQISLNPASDSKTYKEFSHIGDVLGCVDNIEKTQSLILDVDGLLKSEEDYDMADLLAVEKLQYEKDISDQQLKLFNLLNREEHNTDNLILEVRAGVGGEEASLFADELFSMYVRYIDRNKWKYEIIFKSLSDSGGIKEIVCSVQGDRAYEALKFEAGTHRVQRVPKTESSGRIHTSAVTVAVLREPESIELEIKPSDLRIDTYRAQGAGGQHVNTTDSAVRITHIPSKIVAQCQDEKSQHKNKEKALKFLRAKLYDHLQKEHAMEEDNARRTQVGSGDRSEKIRTYNIPQSRVTDHRINETVYDIDDFMNGNYIDAFANSLFIQYKIQEFETKSA